MLLHIHKSDLNNLKKHIPQNELLDLVPERTKDGESDGTSPERLALEDRDYSLLRIASALENGVKCNAYYIVKTKYTNS